MQLGLIDSALCLIDSAIARCVGVYLELSAGVCAGGSGQFMVYLYVQMRLFKRCSRNCVRGRAISFACGAIWMYRKKLYFFFFKMGEL